MIFAFVCFSIAFTVFLILTVVMFNAALEDYYSETQAMGRLGVWALLAIFSYIAMMGVGIWGWVR